jgi:hypothetical protein
VRSILELEQFRDLIQAESQPLSRLHETHPGDIRRAVAADAPVGLVWFGQQAFALIEPNSLYVDPGGAGESADGQILEFFLHIA